MRRQLAESSAQQPRNARADSFIEASGQAVERRQSIAAIDGSLGRSPTSRSTAGDRCDDVSCVEAKVQARRGKLQRDRFIGANETRHVCLRGVARAFQQLDARSLTNGPLRLCGVTLS